MAIPESAKLRQLVSDYYHGLITPESYRSQRASLLDDIGTQPKAAVDATATRPRAEKSAAVAAVPPSPAKPAAAPKATESAGPKKLVIGIVAIASIAAAGYWVLGMLEGPDRSSEIISSAEYLEPTGPGAVMVDGFLERDDWSEESLDGFLVAWEALDEDQRTEAAGGRKYRRLTSQLHRRIREELALGTGYGNRQLSVLTEFAEAIGAPYRQAGPTDREEPAAADEEIVAEAPETEAGLVVTEGPQGRSPEDSPEAPPQTDDVIATTLETVEREAEAEPTIRDAASAESAVTESAPSDPCPSELAKTRRPYCRDALSEGASGPLLVVLPTGKFEMGSDRFETESPVHEVNIVRPVAMSVHEISVQEYLQFCIASGHDCPVSQSVKDAPVVSVSWDDAARYADWLTETTGFSYRLPSEAEWEYAARAGTQTPYSFGDEITPSSAHWSESGSIDAPLARSERGVNRNPFRLYHMSGNVREWVQDSWYENHEGAPADGGARIDQTHDRKVVRGGSFLDPATSLRSAARDAAKASHSDAFTGFRIVREIDDKPLKNNGQ